MCICVCICANNMQILGFGGGGVRSGGGYHWGGRGGVGVRGPGSYIYIHIIYNICILCIHLNSTSFIFHILPNQKPVASSSKALPSCHQWLQWRHQGSGSDRAETPDLPLQQHLDGRFLAFSVSMIFDDRTFAHVIVFYICFLLFCLEYLGILPETSWKSYEKAKQLQLNC